MTGPGIQIPTHLDPIDSIRDRTINQILLSGLLLSGLTFIINGLRDIDMLRSSQAQGKLLEDLINRGAVSIIITNIFYLVRHKISVRWKCVITSLAGVQIFLYYIGNFGLLASAKTMILFSPIVLSLGFGFRVTLTSLLLMTISYLTCAWLFDIEYLTFAYPEGIKAFILNPMTWVTHGIFMSSLSIGLMYIATTQRSALLTALSDSNLLRQKLEAEEPRLVSYRDNLEHMVKEKTTELEITNARLLETSRTLEARSRSHLLQQQELETILEELHSKQAKLMETGKLAAIGMLTAGMAHEINNPLNFINGAVQLMEMELTGSPHSAVFTGSIQRIRESVSRTSTLVGSLNQFGRKTDSMEEVCDLSKISSNVLSILELADSKNKIHLVLPEKQTSIKGNAGKLHQALLNLLQEAVQDVREGGQLQLKLSIEEQEVSLMLEQTNQTAPINAQVENFRTSGRENLRMYICHRIIKEHSGRLLVTLDPNGRKKREIRLPLHA